MSAGNLKREQAAWMLFAIAAVAAVMFGYLWKNAKPVVKTIEVPKEIIREVPKEVIKEVVKESKIYVEREPVVRSQNLMLTENDILGFMKEISITIQTIGDKELVDLIPKEKLRERVALKLRSLNIRVVDPKAQSVKSAPRARLDILINAVGEHQGKYFCNIDYQCRSDVVIDYLYEQKNKSAFYNVSRVPIWNKSIMFQGPVSLNVAIDKHVHEFSETFAGEYLKAKQDVLDAIKSSEDNLP